MSDKREFWIYPEEILEDGGVIGCNVSTDWNQIPFEFRKHASRMYYEDQYEILRTALKKAHGALKLYANYHLESARHMDLERVKFRTATIKPIEDIGKSVCRADGSVPPQDALFTYSDEFRLGKLARQTLTDLETDFPELKEGAE